MINDKWFICFWLMLSPLAVLSMMVLLKDGITYQSLIISVLFGFPQFIILSLVPLAEYYDNKRNKQLTTI
jgi:hypothetical protein